jgi:2,3-dihydroxybenzoate decarboxylase
MTTSRRAFLKNSALASSALAAAGRLSAQDSRSDFQRIAAEETFTIPELLAAFRELVAREPNRSPPYAPTIEPEIADALVDLGDGRIAAMDEARIDKQILVIWSPGVQVFGASQGTELARLTNDRLVEAIRRHPDRFAGLATIAPQNPDAAAQEIERAVGRLGLNGVLINSHTNDEFLDQQKYWPILEAAEALQIPIYLHPRIPPTPMYNALTDYTMYSALWGFGLETSTHVVRLLMSGVFEEFPRLKIVLGHMGEGVPFWLSRLDAISASRPGMPVMARRPSEYFMDHFVIVTSGMFWDPLLLFCHSVLGPERILFGIDYPFAPSAVATRWMDAVPLPDADKRMIYQENAERVFSL